MSSDRWHQIAELFQKTLELPAAERAAFLDTACDGDARLRREVASLLEADDEAGLFLETSPIRA